MPQTDQAAVQRFRDLLAVGKLYDESYWGPGGIDLMRWCRTGHCQRGIAYRDVGPTRDGAANQRRSISAGRKARGMASDSFKESE